MAGSLRIIAGELRGRRLAVPPGRRVRPTADRVREALFSILGAAVPGARVLDPYAGTGALGLEALSRGAATVTFLEPDREALDCLRRNVARLGVEDRSRIVPGRAERLLLGAGIGGPFDLVLVDAPYEEPLTAFLEALERPGLLAPEATISVEREFRSPSIAGALESLRLFDSRRYGRVRLDFLRR